MSPEIVDRATGRKVRSPYLSQEIVDWLLEQQRRANDSPEQLGTVTLTAQGAAIATTPVPMPALTAGYYRVSVYTRITRAATTSSSLTVTIGWTDGAIVLTEAGAAITGNTTSTVQQRTLFLRVDANASVTYSTAYASVGGTSMQYRLDITVEKLPD